MILYWLDMVYKLIDNDDLVSLIEQDQLTDKRLSPQQLQKLDVWVDQYNHNTEPDRGISSSMVLCLLVLERVSEDLVENTLDQVDLDRYQDLQNIVNQLPDIPQLATKSDKIGFLTMLDFLYENPEFERVIPLTRVGSIPLHLQRRISKEMETMTHQGFPLSVLHQAKEKHPQSLEHQLEMIMGSLADLTQFEPVLLQTLDLVREQHKFRGDGPGEVELPSYSDFYPEAYSQDRDWMPRVVLLAKHTLVWLHQLSRKYGSEITMLNQIPNAELEEISSRGFTALWLIGIWERSPASKVIKERMGNHDAAASAYSIWDYTVAEDLGGHDAYYDLSERAGQVGLKLASDMVPNHTGIVSKWVIEHPDWFIQTRDSPFASYRFMSEDLANHPHVSVHLEDKYYSHEDAAVVFKRVDHQHNDVRYIYHGNDGTSIPWNDTAQLDFLQHEVRTHVIDTIVHVAKMFSIIRLDAAMVLTKHHFQRLWYPVPGAGGDIPSRSRFSLDKQEFEQKFPVEFWREVVDRIEKEAPNTLLVAEAFWMLEGYFVRSLGVHRVYNSAFMHMLRDQKNAEYRELIKSTLTYDPRILQRYVNFMSNPDEDTAIDQFGNSDKYFGIAVMMSTLPGMPMFGHGQIEGFREKYGMEFKRDYWQEEPSPPLISTHRRLIFPLLRIRYLFAQVKYFRLYDFYHSDGYVIEDIFAFSNRYDDEFAVVVYNNHIERYAGWIKQSLPFNARLAGISDSENQSSTLANEINHANIDYQYCLFRQFHADQYYLRTRMDLENRGVYIQLNGYQFQIFTDFQLLPSHPDLDELYQLQSKTLLDSTDLSEWIIQDQ